MRFLCCNKMLLCGWPLIAIVGLTVVLRASSIDLAVCRLFYDDESGTWPYFNSQPWIGLFNYGTYPAIVIGIISATIVVVSLIRPIPADRQRFALFLALSLALGPGLLVNGLLKPNWGRPRPMQCVEFGGTSNFIPIGSMNREPLDRSFPSGHASVGFYLMALGIGLIKRNPNWARLLIGFGLVYGLAMGFGRVIQGRHFVSDILWSLAITYFCSLLLSFLVLQKPLRSKSISGKIKLFTDGENRLDGWVLTAQTAASSHPGASQVSPHQEEFVGRPSQQRAA